MCNIRVIKIHTVLVSLQHIQIIVDGNDIHLLAIIENIRTIKRFTSSTSIQKYNTYLISIRTGYKREVREVLTAKNSESSTRSDPVDAAHRTLIGHISI